MMMLLRLAWRNLFRNTRRTLLSGLAVGIGLGALIFVDGIFTGMLGSMIATATDTFPGQGQVHAPGFRETLEPERTIMNMPSVISTLNAENKGILKAYSERTVSFGMVSSAADVASAMVYGITPETEADISRLDEAIAKGEYLSAAGQRKILLGARAAETLGVQVGDRVVLTMAQAGTGQLSQEMFRVGGIFRFNMREADSSLAFVHVSEARKMLGLAKSEAHEIALTFTDIALSGNRGLGLWGRLRATGNEALGWRDIIPQLDAIEQMSGFSTSVTLLLVFGIVALTIMNTLFMSLYERIYEFGVLRAIGTRPGHLAAVVVLEAASLAVVCILIGCALGYGFNIYFGIYGLDYSGVEFAGVTITEPIKTVFTLAQFTLFPAMIFIFALLAAAYPAYYAARLSPAAAMRRSL